MTEKRNQTGPRSIREAAATTRAKRMTPQEVAKASEEAEELDLTGDVSPDSPLGRKAENPPDPNAMPPWVQVPPGLTFPVGKTIGFLRFRAVNTDRPEKGDRQIIIWGLTDAEEKLALKATRGESARTVTEMAKRTIRAIDGVRADWSGKQGPGNVDRFWDEVGPKYRPLVINAYMKTHVLSREETADFFLECQHFMSAVPG